MRALNKLARSRLCASSVRARARRIFAESRGRALLTRCDALLRRLRIETNIAHGCANAPGHQTRRHRLIGPTLRIARPSDITRISNALIAEYRRTSFAVAHSIAHVAPNNILRLLR